MTNIKTILIEDRISMKKLVAENINELNDCITNRFISNKDSDGINLFLDDFKKIYGVNRSVITNNIDVVLAAIVDDLHYNPQLRFNKSSGEYVIVVRF